MKQNLLLTIQPGEVADGSLEGDATFYFKYHVINHKENLLEMFLIKMKSGSGDKKETMLLYDSWGFGGIL